MKNLWSDRDARAYVRRYGAQGVNADLARRVYTTRLLGGDPRLVLHGGGNTSVKTVATDITGEVIDVLCVKGSGWDMGDIEPPGLPAVRLDPLRELHMLDSLSDEEMVNVQRRNLLNSKSPNPSVETLLHAFLPHKFVDHTHSTAVLALTDQPDGAKICRDLYGDRAALVPYIMPGFALAKACAQVHAQHPDVEGLILLKHGIFTFGDSAEEAYGRMIDLVSLAERRLQTGRRNPVFATPKNIP
ncbi:MAG: class II aldolase/adducin family protein, partial [Proteobacteria bacterium]|nr:class II aldolase/adducin family protein [Pseudomonadota bacterium]